MYAPSGASHQRMQMEHNVTINSVYSNNALNSEPNNAGNFGTVSIERKKNQMS